MNTTINVFMSSPFSTGVGVDIVLPLISEFVFPLNILRWNSTNLCSLIDIDKAYVGIVWH